MDFYIILSYKNTICYRKLYKWYVVGMLVSSELEINNLKNSLKKLFMHWQDLVFEMMLSVKEQERAVVREP